MLNDKLRILIARLLPELQEKQPQAMPQNVYNLPTLKTRYDLSTHYMLNSEFDYILRLAKEQMPDLESFINDMQGRHLDFTIGDAIKCCSYLLGMLDIEDISKMNIEKGNIFQGARDKLNEASVCFRGNDCTGTINNLNTCLELLLKEKFHIPTTIRGINTANIIEIAIKHNIGPTKFFEQARKYVTDVDNKIKHTGYVPSKPETIHALKSMEELSRELENCQITLTEDIINKIYAGV